MDESPFDPGQIEITIAAQTALTRNQISNEHLLQWHRAKGQTSNKPAGIITSRFVVGQDRSVFSKCQLASNQELWVITAEDQSVTHIILSEEYRVVEVGILEGYAIWSSSYDQENNALIAVEELYTGPLLQNLSSQTALDVGSGTGRLALKLARQGVAVTALDQSAEMLAVAQAKAQQENLTISFQTAPILEGLAELEKEKFDLVTCALVLCHVEELKQAVAEMARVLKQGGTLIITDFHPASVTEGWRTEIPRRDTSYFLTNVVHTRDDYENAVQAAGLTIVQIEDIPFKATPPGIFSEASLEKFGDIPFCLLLQATK